MKDYDWKPEPCPQCGEEIDAQASLEGPAPRPGDVSVCAYCAVAMVFTEDSRLRIITLEEEEGLSNRERRELDRVQQAVRDYHGVA